MDKFEIVASQFLELASEQRLKILDNLSSKPYRLSVLAKKMELTPQEIHRNMDRLSKSGFVKKGTDEHFRITSIGRLVLSQMPLVLFISKNQKYFSTHDLDSLPKKFSRRLGVLETCTHVRGVTNVIDTWKKILNNASEFVCDVTSEYPAGLDDVLVGRVKKGVKYRHIFSSDFEEYSDRDGHLQKIGYYDLIQNGKILRKEVNNTGFILIVSEKEAAIVFPNNDEPDLRHMFYGKSSSFQDWCLDFFEHYWKKAKTISRNHPKTS
ncbi:transcriptional regulator protein-like protein [Candidatus Nitrosopumilus koreensis AR1]|uniref:Transcriptional regulator protein-like protein n=1 Tax=Candidatus Nitrosopumilus koreensis AR1 TaxID=1229908 RepID=K0B4H6_9ARCH|nr:MULTISPECIES: transcriptional regulator [Nitrosopumilus]AFS81063.1 transcriptional regulator protein-like protein [Candidatus Nitrosopumilus koreensis AR1]